MLRSWLVARSRGYPGSLPLEPLELTLAVDVAGYILVADASVHGHPNKRADAYGLSMNF